MSQVLQWIRTNDYFVTVVDRDFISEKDNTPVSVRVSLKIKPAIIIITFFYRILNLITIAVMYFIFCQT